jgi:hypothetical protein
MNVGTRVVHKDAASGVHFVLTGLAFGGVETSLDRRDKVIHGNSLAWLEVIRFDGSLFRDNGLDSGCTGRASLCFSVLTRGTLWKFTASSGL